MTWDEAALGTICRVVSGATPSTSVAAYWNGDIPWITPADMSADRSQVLTRGARLITGAGYDSCSAVLVPPGSVIVSSRAPVGYVAIAGAELCTNQGCKTAVPPPFLEPRYLYWYLVNAKPDLESRASGTTFKEISAKRFAETLLRWPSRAEQLEIVEILEDHLSRLDAAADYESAAARRASLLRRATIARLIPADAPTQTLSSLAINSGYGTSTKCTYDASGHAVVRIPNLQDGRVDLSDLKRAVDTKVDLSKLMLTTGDLLIVRTNGS